MLRDLSLEHHVIGSPNLKSSQTHMDRSLCRPFLHSSICLSQCELSEPQTVAESAGYLAHMAFLLEQVKTDSQMPPTYCRPDLGSTKVLAL
ncbi:hypothetical protein I79_025875 [Cricetulus griseus]|uniref:Uncharacterized protein n=1 Tax=Cricetulus griseus TaxID=10029 RepID=G3IPG6_CRIGR|nr:hypothetical protein I79_025875 [Cricetulus griseus]